jgi:RNA-binding protein
MLSKDQIKQFKAKAHDLKPVVMIGGKGLTEAVIKEINIALDVHELIKVKAAQLERDHKQALADEICEQTGCEFVQNIGGVFVFYRKKKED